MSTPTYTIIAGMLLFVVGVGGMATGFFLRRHWMGIGGFLVLFIGTAMILASPICVDWQGRTSAGYTWQGTVCKRVGTEGQGPPWIEMLQQPWTWR